MTEPLLNLTIVFEPAEDGWVVASIPEIPGVHSQGKSREEARENVIDALHEILAIRFGEGAAVDDAADSESLRLVIAA
ncbi:MAG: type II toxin-antitoxin system HicB family antitoxin [Solirubrobacterales bacterium]